MYICIHMSLSLYIYIYIIYIERESNRDVLRGPGLPAGPGDMKVAPMRVPPGNSTFRFQKCQETEPVTHKFELPSATSHILATCKNQITAGWKTQSRKKSYNQPVHKLTSKPMMQTSNKYIYVSICVYLYTHMCIYILYRPVHTCA